MTDAPATSSAPARETGQFEMTDHVCSVCLGRILMHVASGQREFVCSNCGIKGTSVVRSICCCGLRVPGMGRHDFRDAGIRCQRNPNPTPEVPAQIIAREVD